MNRSLALLLAGTFLSAMAAGQIFTIPNSPVAQPQNGNRVDVIVKVDSTREKSLPVTPLSVTDLSKNGSETIEQTGEPTYLGGSAQKGYWRTPWQITGLRPGASEVHMLLLRLGKAMDVVPLTIRGPADLQVSVTGPGYPLRLLRSHSAQMRLSTNGVLTHVAPTQATLVEEKSGQPLALNNFDLIDKAGRSAAAPEGLTVAESVQPLYLQVSKDFSKPGKFTGNMNLGSREKPDLGNFVLTVYSTSTKYRLWGVLCLFLGVVTYFVIAVWIKVRSRWILALLPAARLREEASQLLLITEDVQQKTNYTFTVLLAAPGNPGSLRDVLDRLSEQSLTRAGYLPWKFAIPFAVQDLSMQYQSFLLTTGNEVSSFGIIVRWGLASVLTMWPQVMKLGLQAAGNTALQNLDTLGLFSGPSNLLTTQVQAAINALETAISNAQAAGGAIQPRTSYGVPGSQQLTVQLERLSIFVWIAWAVLTVAVGSCALVWFNDGFGTSQDLVQCFLWGAGMPAVGQGFGGLSAGSVTSAFSLQIAR